MLSQELEYSQYPEYKEYVNTFIQRLPRYAVKYKGKSWRTKKKFLVDTPITAHMEGKYYIGVLGKWYPGYSVLDIDDAPMDSVERIRDGLRLDPSNSMLCSSESEGSYHILFKPTYKTKPPTIRLLQNILEPFGARNNIEIYPKPNKPIRLPFGAGQDCLDIEYRHLENWKDKYFWFNKLDELDLSTIPYQQQEFNLYMPAQKQKGTYQIGKELLQTGLNNYNSRHESQFCVLYYLWSNNVPPEQAYEICYKWIKDKHNGYSKEVNSGDFASIRKEIKKQAEWIYGHYEQTYIYPDETHNSFNGYITKPDIADIVRLSNASLPRMNFLYNIVKYCYPRRFRNFINISSEKLIEWSQRNYLQYLDEFKGTINRGEAYQVDKFSKSIKLDWKYKDSNNAILEDSRAPDTFKDTIKLSYKPQEFRELLQTSGSERTNAIKTVKRIFEV